MSRTPSQKNSAKARLKKTASDIVKGTFGTDFPHTARELIEDFTDALVAAREAGRKAGIRAERNRRRTHQDRTGDWR